ncbi:hypothetical protein RRG08_047401 [Elysia crispata]|uniref:Uncharacterized protein n=1 Tax=Elysia crispata TaxID=231223 RepID=A0AAE0YUM2_9GAST|nr:hypothetical protein RRG08_047401 [Elysia crispata]
MSGRSRQIPAYNRVPWRTWSLSREGKDWGMAIPVLGDSCSHIAWCEVDTRIQKNVDTAKVPHRQVRITDWREIDSKYHLEEDGQNQLSMQIVDILN